MRIWINTRYIGTQAPITPNTKHQDDMRELIKKLFPHRHKWQIRGRNRYGTPTYRFCLKCRKAQERVNNPFEDDKFEYCEPIPELDNQFDKNNNYIFTRRDL